MSSKGLHGDILDAQRRYYNARAGEYDDWFFRRGRYDRGREETDRWFSEIQQARSALMSLPLQGDILELACGTGLWTVPVSRRARSLVAVDASAEMIGVARTRLGDRASKVEFVQRDLFDWEPVERFDGVVFCFWISHVPGDLMDGFAESIARSLRPGGFVYFLDSRRDPRSTALDHRLPDVGEERMTRRLDDGREFSIIKNFWSSDHLVQLFENHGIALQVTETPTYFQYGVGWLAASSGRKTEAGLA